MMTVWTTESLLRWTTEAFEHRGIESARLDAELLWSNVLGTDRLALWMHPERPATSEERDQYRASVQRRLQGECVAYITGNREFYGRSFSVGEGVLVPRPETELLVDFVLARWPQRPCRVLDIGTGSGCIAVTLACETDAEVEAIDCEQAAVEFAQKNAQAHQAQVKVEHCALDQFQATAYDVIVTNPPYLTDAEMASAAPEVKAEPEVALYGGADGLDWYRAHVEKISKLAAQEALFACEIGIQQGADVVRLLSQYGARDATVLQDYTKRDRFVFCRFN